VQDTENAILDMIDRLTLETKQIFNLTQAEIDEDFDRAVGMQRTRSVTAASHFTKGMEYSYLGSFLESAQAFEAAIVADEDFAMAYAKASEAYKNLGYDAKAESLSLIAVDKVVKLIDRVHPIDRTFILANHGSVTYNAEWAIESYNEFVEAYPNDPEGYYKLGLTYETISEWELAAENLERALELDPKFGSARYELGKVLIRKEDLDGALTELEKALSYYKGIGNREGEAGVLNAIGVVYRRRNEFDEAVSYFEASIEIKEELGDRRGVAASLGNLGLVYQIMGKLDEAVEVLERSLEIKREIGDKLGISTALNKIGQTYQSSGRYEEALTYFERGYETRKEVGAKHLMASSLSDMGTIYSLLGRYDKALEVDSMALALRVEIGDERAEAQTLRNIAETLMARGRFDEASANLRRALSIDTSLEDTRSLADDDLALGSHCLGRGKADSAIWYLSRAFGVQEALDAKPAMTVIMSLLGDAYLKKGDYKQASLNLDRAFELANLIGEMELAVDVTVDRARLYSGIGYAPGCDSIGALLDSYDENSLGFQTKCRLKLTRASLLCARSELPEATQINRELTDIVGGEEVRCRVESMLLSGRIAAGEGNLDEASRTLDAVVRQAQRYSFHDVEAEALWRLAGVVSRQDNGDEALQLCDEALEIISNIGLAAYDCLITCAEIRLATGDTAGAASFMNRALEVAASTYEEKCPPRLRSYYLARKRIPHYVDQVEDLISQTGGPAPARDYRSIFGLKS
jgi:tetratricopeptide (TPR) repeat protein